MGSALLGSLRIACFLTEGSFWVLPLTYFYLPKSAMTCLFSQSVKIYYFCSGYLSVDPICRQPSFGSVLSIRPVFEGSCFFWGGMRPSRFEFYAASFCLGVPNTDMAWANKNKLGLGIETLDSKACELSLWGYFGIDAALILRAPTPLALGATFATKFRYRSENSERETAKEERRRRTRAAGSRVSEPQSRAAPEAQSNAARALYSSAQDRAPARRCWFSSPWLRVV